MTYRQRWLDRGRARWDIWAREGASILRGGIRGSDMIDGQGAGSYGGGRHASRTGEAGLGCWRNEQRKRRGGDKTRQRGVRRDIAEYGYALRVEDNTRLILEGVRVAQGQISSGCSSCG